MNFNFCDRGIDVLAGKSSRVTLQIFFSHNMIIKNYITWGTFDILLFINDNLWVIRVMIVFLQIDLCADVTADLPIMSH